MVVACAAAPFYEHSYQSVVVECSGKKDGEQTCDESVQTKGCGEKVEVEKDMDVDIEEVGSPETDQMEPSTQDSNSDSPRNSSDSDSTSDHDFSSEFH